MPISEYFKGKGSSVMKDMQERYGAEKGKRVFYATANKEKQEPKGAQGRMIKRKLAARSEG